MNKVTKKSLQMGWDSHDTEIIKIRKELRELRQDVLRLEKLTDDKLLDKPKLKALDQSVFDGLDEKWRFAAVNKDGFASLFKDRPCIVKTEYLASYTLHQNLGGNYDATNWKNSLIERESKELTGKELVGAMLDNGKDKVLVRVSNINDQEFEKMPVTFAKRQGNDIVTNNGNTWAVMIPVDIDGKPLNAKEAGL